MSTVEAPTQASPKKKAAPRKKAKAKTTKTAKAKAKKTKTAKRGAKKAKAKETTKTLAVPTTAPRRAGSGLTDKQAMILNALKGGREMTRRQLKEKTGAKRMPSKLLGAPTRDGLGVQGGGLEGAGLIQSFQYEGSRQLTYTITAKGKKALQNAKV